jgi:hypothetical protein
MCDSGGNPGALPLQYFFAGSGLTDFSGGSGAGSAARAPQSR